MINKLKAYLKHTHEQLSTDEYLRKNVIKGVPNDTFYHLFKVMFTVTPSEDVYSTEFGFANDNIEYDGLVFTQVYGQGTHCELALVEDSRFQRG